MLLFNFNFMHDYIFYLPTISHSPKWIIRKYISVGITEVDFFAAIKLLGNKYDYQSM